ncbi:Flagellar capping protein FliD [Thiovulum sp. ES]|nr:Flagellar capping protein FliD [Thiovulum sp. ES]
MASTGLIGLGSEAVTGTSTGLSQETLDKLRAADDAVIIDPIDRNIEGAAARSEAFGLISEKVTAFSSTVESLNDEMLFLQRSAYVSEEGINLSIDKGVSPQTITVETLQLAKQDIVQSDGFSSLTETVASEDTTMSITVGGIEYSFDLTSSTTMTDLKDLINDSSAPVTAKVLKTGDSEYRLTITSNDTGDDSEIIVSEEGLSTNFSAEENHIQKGVDSEFLFNGTPITRNSNSITDLVVGIELELTQVNENPIEITIEPDTNSIMLQVQSFVDAYNELSVLIEEMTKFDQEGDETGAFQGDNNITAITQTIKRKLLSMDSENRSLIEFGISLNNVGSLEFDSETFLEKFNEDPENIENFFLGQDVEDRGITTHEDGVFYDLNQIMEMYTNSDGILNNISNNITTEQDRLNDEREKNIAMLDGRYARMAEQFIQADTLIAQWNQQFNSIQMMIDMESSK